MFKFTGSLRTVALAVGIASCWMSAPSRAEDRSFNGTGNNLSIVNRGAADTPVIRITYPSFYTTPQGGMLTDAQRPNARTISNAISNQVGSLPSARGLCDYIWAWGQFLDHDMSLSTSSNGALLNGEAPIAINDPNDPLGPNPIPFVRSNFVTGVVRSPRDQINEVTSYIDASQVYGSNVARAAALRTDGGLGAKLTLSPQGLLPFNTLGLFNDNDGPFPDEEMFLAGDVRANENVLLTSLQTVFAREHNRLVDRIAEQQPTLEAEQQYQLARKIVGAEMQIITYREFLPALLGSARAPKAEAYQYQSSRDASVTNSFAHAAYRFGHSTLSSTLNLQSEDGTTESLPLRYAFFNPGVLANDATKLDDLLLGASRQTSQEVDVQLVDDVRNFLFGPPGAGGLDLAALNIQRGRDHGLPDYNRLRIFYQLPSQSFNTITSDVELRQALQTIYNSNTLNIDPWIGALAENHLSGSSVGSLINGILNNQFTRTRDGDRLFYLSDALGLYANRILKPEIAALIDLNTLRLSDVIEANSLVAGLQPNVFFAFPRPGDFDLNGVVDGADLALWREDMIAEAGASLRCDADGDGNVDGDDFLIWQRHVDIVVPPPQFIATEIPEPTSALLLLAALVGGRRLGGASRRHC